MVDLAWYKNGVKTCRNWIVKPYGGVCNRSGGQFIAEQKTSATRARLIKFSFNTAQNYVIEFGVGYLRIFAGGVLQTYGTTPPSAWLTSTGYSIGSYVRSSGVDYYCLVDHTSGTFATDLAAGKWYALVASADGAVLELPTSYTEAELRSLVVSQNADVLTVTHNNHPPMLLSRYSSTKWTFQPQQLNSGPFEDDNVSPATAVWVSATTGPGITISATKPLFYAKHVGMLFKISQKDFGQSWLPGKAATLGDIIRSGGNYYIALTTGTTGQNIPIGTGDHWNDGGVDWGYLHNGYGVARITAVAGGGLSCTADVLSRIPDGATTTGYVSEVNLGSAAASGALTKYTVTAHGLPAGFYGTALVNLTWVGWRVRAAGLVVGWNALPVRYIDANTLEFQLDWYLVNLGSDDQYGIVANKFKPPLNATTSASYKWAFGAFGNPALGDATNGYGPGYPAAVTYYQQRKVFGGTLANPDGIWTSKTGSFDDFGQTNPVLDDDSVVYKLSSSQVNQIRHLLQLDKLLVLTQGAVWATGTGNQTDVLTPGNIGVKLQSYQGVSALPPIGIGGAALYVQEMGQIVRDMNYQWANDAYTGQNLTAKGSHLVDGHSLVEWAFQQSPLNVVWMVRDDGVLLGLTYLREQEVAGWHRHDTDGLYESVCCVTEGNEDVLYVTVKRNIGGATKRYIERFATRLVTDIKDAFFVDSGVSYDNRNTTATTITMSGGTLYNETEEITLTASAGAFVYPGTSDVGDQIVVTDAAGVSYQVTITSTTSTTVAKGRPVSAVPAALRSPGTAWSWARNTLPGLGHLEGKSVMVLADGNVAGPFTVVSGAVTLVTPAVRVHAGLSYTCDLETLPLAPSQQEVLRGNFKLVNVLRAILLESRSIFAGPDETKLYEAKTRTVEGAFQTPPNLVTGVVEIRLSSTWERNGTTLIRHSLPTPVGVLALMPEVSVGGA